MSEPTAPTHYFADRKEKLLKDLGVLFSSARRILPAHVKASEVPAILDETRQGFGEMLRQLPDLGQDRNLFNSSIVAGVAALAYMRALESRGVPSENIHESLYTIYFDAYSSLPRLLKTTLRWYEFSGAHMRQLRAFARWTQERALPENYVVEFIPGNGHNFDFGFDVTECALVKFYKRMHAEEHLPYVCIGDFAASSALNTGLRRTTTISNGAAICDFRYGRKRDSLSGLPLEELPEYKNRRAAS
ncbi:MAG TPA: L-2-amino-thiazoline-4-carboxylic acid hydrolase [Anaerolineales bacterium]|nr:L-2-amino-thiazoline-4-carboxylic acid hydrolase [Anaerolineales bacterium]